MTKGWGQCTCSQKSNAKCWSLFFLGWFVYKISAKISVLEGELDETESRAEEAEEWVLWIYLFLITSFMLEIEEAKYILVYLFVG